MLRTVSPLCAADSVGSFPGTFKTPVTSATQAAADLSATVSDWLAGWGGGLDFEGGQQIQSKQRVEKAPPVTRVSSHGQHCRCKCVDCVTPLRAAGASQNVQSFALIVNSFFSTSPTQTSLRAAGVKEKKPPQKHSAPRRITSTPPLLASPPTGTRRGDPAVPPRALLLPRLCRGK